MQLLTKQISYLVVVVFLVLFSQDYQTVTFKSVFQKSEKHEKNITANFRANKYFLK